MAWKNYSEIVLWFMVAGQWYLVKLVWQTGDNEVENICLSHFFLQSLPQCLDFPMLDYNVWLMHKKILLNVRVIILEMKQRKALLRQCYGNVTVHFNQGQVLVVEPLSNSCQLQ